MSPPTRPEAVEETVRQGNVTVRSDGITSAVLMPDGTEIPGIKQIQFFHNVGELPETIITLGRVDLEIKPTP